ncbi:MAG: hypothetical protein WCF03_05590 [Nitrososphaeraceae archaeon]
MSGYKNIASIIEVDASYNISIVKNDVYSDVHCDLTKTSFYDMKEYPKDT